MKISERYVEKQPNVPKNSCSAGFLTPRVKKTLIQKSYKEGKWEGRRCVQGLQMDPNNYFTDAQVHLFSLNIVLL